MKHFFLSFLFLSLLSCTESGPKVESSGDDDLDKTASFLLYWVEKVKKRPSLGSPSEIAGYLTSAMGKGEIVPPSEEFEPDAAKYYKGPRPSDKVNYFPEFSEDNFFEKQIVLSGDDERGVIIAEGYSSNEDEDPTFTWEWKVSKN